MDGSGRLGVAVLATLRDEDGSGPSTAWTGSLTGPAGPVDGDVAYLSPTARSWFVGTWPAEVPWDGTWTLALAPPGAAGLSADFEVLGSTGIAPPEPFFDAAAGSIVWAPVPGAASYACRAHGAAGIASEALGTVPSCEVSTLEPGAYFASIFAYSADLTGIARSDARRPALPARLDVSEARVAFEIPGAAAPAALSAAGGGYSDGTSATGRRLAVWVSILKADGTPTDVPWTVEVVGPGLPVERPLTFEYGANFSRTLVWADGVPAQRGSYGLLARSSAGRVARAFAIGALTALDAPADLVATGGAQGSAGATWSPVAGAASYLVSARRADTRTLVTNQWVVGTTASFPAGTFTAGESYELSVAACDANLAGETAPSAFAITENGVEPARFVAR